MTEFQHPLSSPPQRITKFLARVLEGTSHSAVFSLLRKHRVRIDGRLANMQAVVPSGSIVKVFLPLAEKTDEQTRAGNLYKRLFLPSIVHADDDIIVLDKPAGLLTQGDAERGQQSTVAGLAEAYAKERGKTAHLVHRLDRETSGLMVVALGAAAARQLSSDFAERKVDKRYLALVKGRMPTLQGTIERRLKKLHNKVVVAADGEAATTHYDVVAALGNASLLALHITTGRMHQIRAHLASIGHNIAGDKVYGDVQFNHMLQQMYGLRRQYLHAFQLSFTHPVTGKAMRFERGLPKDLEQMIKDWK